MSYDKKNGTLVSRELSEDTKGADMSNITDKVVLSILCTVLLMGETDFTRPVIVTLVTLTLAALTIYFTKQRTAIVLLVLFAACCVIEPMFTFFLPLLFYDCYRYSFWWGFASLGALIRAWDLYEPWEMLLWAGLSLMAVLLSYRTKRMEELKQDWIHLRDTSTELNMVMRQRNKELLEKQDYEVHLATLKERNRIAREIHDHVGHMLSRSILQVGALTTIHKEEPLHEQLTSINDTLNQAMNNIRESVHDLHDESIDLKQAIVDTTKEMREKYDLHFEYDMSKAVPRTIKYCFIAIIKEAMSNIVKHSNADTVTIILREHPGFYQLSVEDNGTLNKDAEKAKTAQAKSDVLSEHGIGLSNMKERVEALNGTLHIQKENGYKIFVSIRKTEEAK